MTTGPLVSILIPAYKSEKWIGETLECVLEQSWSNLEVIVVDDGSPDNTLSVARQFEAGNVLIHSQKNAGAPAARNRAFSLSQGEYVIWLDADDLLSKDRIKNQFKALEERGTENSLASCNWGHFYYRTTKAKFVHTSLCKDLSPVDWLTHKMGENLHMQTATWLVSRKVTELAGPWDSTLVSDDDGEYFCRVILNCDQIIFDPESYVYYRITDSGSWGSLGNSDRKLEAQWKSMKLHIEYLLSMENSERTRCACVYYLNTWAHNFFPHRIDIMDEIKLRAKELGGDLIEKSTPWKWALLNKLVGKKYAKKTVNLLRNAKSKSIQNWDKIMYNL